MKRQLKQVQRVFEPCRLAEDVLTDGYQKLVPIMRRQVCAAAGGPEAPGLRGLRIALRQTNGRQISSGGCG